MQLRLKDVGGGLLESDSTRSPSASTRSRSASARFSARRQVARDSPVDRRASGGCGGQRWYPDVGDESDNALRGFSVDRILYAIVLDQSAFGVPELELEQYCASACGIIGGKAGKAGKAPVLRFTPKRRGGFR